MSVIMTAGKKFATAQEKKKKAKSIARVPSVSEEPRPPYSDHTTSVWYWILDGQATTVMFNKGKKEVWCNGFLLTTYDGFLEGQEDFEMTDEGDVLDFTIFVPQTQISHQGRLIRLAETEIRGVVTHQLLVDDWLIPEHVEESQVASYEAGFQYQ